MLFEIQFLINETKNALFHLREWTQPEKVRSRSDISCESYFHQLYLITHRLFHFQPPKSLMNVMDGVLIYNDPYGVVLIIGAWNYPLQLTLLPVSGAIAAGNCVIIKPSEVATASAQLMAKLVPKYLDQVRLPECFI